MATSSTSSMRRFASTIFVFFALLVACVGATAMPCDHGSADRSSAQQQVAFIADDATDASDPATLPSLEDNSGGLDDTFDVPSLHVVTVTRPATAHPGGQAPAAHEHHHSFDLRPPIA